MMTCSDRQHEIDLAKVEHFKAFVMEHCKTVDVTIGIVAMSQLVGVLTGNITDADTKARKLATEFAKGQIDLGLAAFDKKFDKAACS